MSNPPIPDDQVRQLKAELLHGLLHPFADWPNPPLPRGRAGVYTVWRGEEFIYVGMAGRGMKAAEENAGVPSTNTQVGLWSRLNSHASGRRSGGQFCIYVFDRLLLPDLTRQQIQEAAGGQLSLDGLVRTLIRQTLSYRYVLVPDGAAALAIERQIQRDGLEDQRPLFNPLGTTRPGGQRSA